MDRGGAGRIAESGRVGGGGASWRRSAPGGGEAESDFMGDIEFAHRGKPIPQMSTRTRYADSRCLGEPKWITYAKIFVMREVAGTIQAHRRHPKVTAYRCYLPVLAGFTGFCCVGPEPELRFPRTTSG